MSKWILDAARDFVREWDLHQSGTPVDLSVLEDSFAPAYVDLTEQGILGYGLFLDDDASDAPMGTIFIEQELPRDDRRLVYAHELGHMVAGHSGTPVTSKLNSFQHDRNEREAWLAAAVLLIPPDVVSWDETIDSVAAACRVPEELVAMFHRSLVG